MVIGAIDLLLRVSADWFIAALAAPANLVARGPADLVVRGDTGVLTVSLPVLVRKGEGVDMSLRGPERPTRGALVLRGGVDMFPGGPERPPTVIEELSSSSSLSVNTMGSEALLSSGFSLNGWIVRRDWANSAAKSRSSAR